jgi:NitT/TauT family transport system substrate-binding protein
MKYSTLLFALLFLVCRIAPAADPLKIGYSDWPGFTLFELAKQKGWFEEAGLQVELVWSDYQSSLDAYANGKLDGVMIVGTDALVNGARGAKSKIIALLDYSEGSDMIIGKPGIESIKDLQGQKIGIEKTLVEHLLLLKALEMNGMKQSDVELVNMPTSETPKALAQGEVAAIGVWYPISGQVLKQNPGCKKLFTSREAKGLIFDVLAVNPTSLSKNQEAWEKIVKIYYRCVDYIYDPTTRDETIKILAAKVGVEPLEYAENVSGTHFLTLSEAKAALVEKDDLLSIYGSLKFGNEFNLDNKVYKEPQKIHKYVVRDIIEGL